MYQYDPTVLNPMQLPAGVDRRKLVPDLLAQLAEFEILYPDVPAFKTILRSWSSHRVDVWTRVLKAQQAQYDPIENYDRREEWTDTTSASGEADAYSAGYNPNALGDPPGMVKQNRTETGSAGNGHHEGRTHGNIGVTTSQQMLEQELTVADKLDVYQYIIRDFKRRFCLPIY